MTDQPAPSRSPRQPVAPLPPCCHWCGYILTGLQPEGVCPECGTAYSPATARTFQPWPGAFEICLLVGWPVILWFVLAGIVMVGGEGADGAAMFTFCSGWVLAIVAVVNAYFQVRSLLRRSMPDRTRTKGPVAVFRAVGTVTCIIIGLVLILPPLACAACIFMYM